MGQHGGTVVSAVVSQIEGPGFNGISRRTFLYGVRMLCFSPGALTQSKMIDDLMSLN